MKKRTVTFEPSLVINGEAYTGKVRQTMKLNTAEEWIVVNKSDGTHPFHIHVNPFFVTHINGEELEEGHPLRRWQGTIALPGRRDGKDGSITFKSRYETFTGKFVIHCHILRHEDAGMMQAVEIVA